MEDFLPDLQVTIRALCRVDVVIRGSGERTNLYQDSRDGVVVGKTGRDFLSIDLERPFFLDLGKLQLVTEYGNNGIRTFERTVLNEYRMAILLQCLDVDNGAQFFNFVEGKAVNARRDGESPPILHAYWGHLPICPRQDELLELKRPHQQLSIPGYGLRVSMNWANRRETPLVRYNRQLRSHAAQNQMPTPDSSAQSEGSHTIRIVYLFNEGEATRSINVDGLGCVICGDGIAHTSLDRLLLHYSIHHGHFKFDVGEGTKAKSVSESKTIEISLLDRPVESPEPEREFTWVAPADRPFDAAAYLKGEDVWTGHSQPQNRTRQSLRRGVGRAVKEPATRPPITGPGTRRLGEKRPVQAHHRKSFDEVPDLVVPARGKKRRHRIPRLKDVRFYRTTSKRIMEPGEELSESDEEVDEHWLEQSNHSELTVVDMSKPGLDFHRAFNQHLGIEQTASNVLARDAMVRFCRKYRVELQHEQWRHQFSQKMKLLSRNGILDEGTVNYCTSLLLGPPQIDDDVRGKTLMAQESAAANSSVNENDRRPSTQGATIPNGKPCTAAEALTRKRAASTEHPRSDASVLALKKKRRDDSRPLLSGTSASNDQAQNHNNPATTETSPGSAINRMSFRSSRPPSTTTSPSSNLPARRRFDPKRGFINPSEQETPRPSLSAPPTQKPLEKLPTPSSEHDKNQNESIPPPGLIVKQRAEQRFCICGRSAIGNRGTVECENRDCERGRFHLGCMGLERRVGGWRCGGCRPT